MDTLLFFKSIGVGFAVAAPVGPVGLLCFRRGLERGWAAGFMTGLGAAVADTVFAGIAVLGLAAVLDAVLGQQVWLEAFCGAALILLGGSLLLARPAERPSRRQAGFPSRLFGDWASSFVVTLMNPMTALGFVAIFAGLGFARKVGDAAGSLTVLGGVFLGSGLWWVILSAAAALLHRRLDAYIVVRINRLIGLDRKSTRLNSSH